jgi:Mrp family chromosome partitioning ATPase
MHDMDAHTQIERILLATIANNGRTLAVCGVGRGVGTSLVARLVARRAAHAGARVLLMEAAGELEAGPARSSFVPGDGAASQHVVAHADGYDRLVLAPSSQTRNHFNDVQALRDMMANDLSRYVAIVADLPALNVTDWTALSPVSAAVAFDAVLLVAMAGRSSPFALASAATALTAAKANLVGVVSNDILSPTLGQEMARESRRLSRVSPRLAARMARWSRRSTLLTGHA